MNTKTFKLLVSAFMAFALPSFLFAQEGELGIQWGGFVKVDTFSDSRAVVAARDDMFMLYPAARKQVTQAPGEGVLATYGIFGTDKNARDLYVYSNNEDLNAVRQASITAVQTRLKGKIKGPDAFGAKMSAYIETDFFGTTNSYTWLMRMRHGFVKFDWGKNKLLVGQYWHPLFVPGYHPVTVQFSPLSPIHPFNRSPQIRYSMDLGGGLNIHLSAIYRAYHTDTGPSTNSASTSDAYGTKYKRWASKPDLDLQLEYKSDLISGGITIDVNELRPYDDNPTYYTSDSDGDGNPDVTASQVGVNQNTVTGITYQLFLKYNFDKNNNGQIRFNYVQGENTRYLVMLGGYAQKANFLFDSRAALLTAGVIDAQTAATLGLLSVLSPKEYTPIQISSYWVQFIYGKEVEYSIIYGKSENKGAKDDVATFYSRGSNVKSVVSIIPQVRFKKGKTIIGIMYGYFQADYMEDDKVFQAIYQQIKQNAGIAGSDYTTMNLNGLTIADPTVRDSKGKIGKTYRVIDRRLQVSFQQNF